MLISEVLEKAEGEGTGLEVALPSTSLPPTDSLSVSVGGRCNHIYTHLHVHVYTHIHVQQTCIHVQCTRTIYNVL